MNGKKFDEYIDRTGTNSVKWDFRNEVFGREDILPMWVADSDWRTSESIIDSIVERARHGIFGYTSTDEETDRIVVDWLERRYGWKVDPNWIVYANGVVPSLRVAIKAFSCTGEGVILQPPVYYPFFTSVKNSGSQVVTNQLKMKNGKYRMDYEELRDLCCPDQESIPADPPPTLMVLCNPHNPVGRVWEREELERLGSICLENEVLMVSDDIHSEFVYQGNSYLPLASISPEIADNSITLTSPSKAFNTAGLPASIAIIKNEQLRERFKKAGEKLLTRPSVFGLEALIAAYKNGEDWVDDQLDYLEGNREYTLEFVETKIPRVHPIAPEGTTLLWMDFRKLNLSSEELKDLIVNEARVGLDLGPWFGPGGEGFARLNFACPRQILEEGLNRISEAVEATT